MQYNPLYQLPIVARLELRAEQRKERQNNVELLREQELRSSCLDSPIVPPTLCLQINENSKKLMNGIKALVEWQAKADKRKADLMQKLVSEWEVRGRARKKREI